VLGDGKLAMTQRCVLAAQKPTAPGAASPAAWARGEGGDGDRLFSRVCCNKTRGDGFKLEDR